MKIIKFNNSNIDQAVNLLNKNQVIVLPTCTSYALAVKANNTLAIKKIYKIKNRDLAKPLLLLSDSISRVLDNFIINEFSKKIIQQYWPGPLTILLQTTDPILQKNPQICKNNLVAIRVTSNKGIQEVIKKVDYFITATSANISGEKDSFSASDILANFAFQDLQPEAFFDQGDLSVSKPSTIIKIDNQRIEIIRQGAIKLYEDNRS